MSKVKIQGNASGTGVLTVEAPNTNTDRTITLPDSTGTLVDDTTAVTKDASGNVGIGTSSPAKPLDVNGSIRSRSYGFNVSDGTTTAGLLVMHKQITGSGTDKSPVLFAETGNELSFMTDGRVTERMRIDSSGNVLVGTTDIDGEVGSSSTSGLAFAARVGYGLRVSTSESNYWNRIGNGAVHKFRRSGANVGNITVTSSATSYNTSSDYRLKENVVPMTGSIDRLKALKPSRFNFIADADTTVDGFLAHEAGEVVPECASGEKDAMRTEEYEVLPAEMNSDGDVINEAVMGEREVPDYQGIDQSKLVPLLVASLQEAVAKIEALETRVTQLENV